MTQPEPAASGEPHPAADTLLRLDVERVAVGGAGVAHAPDGRVVFVEGALPGETVTAIVTAEHARHLDARAVDVVHASPDRRTPPCPYVAAGCGGCGWQHVHGDTQRELRRQIVEQALERIGRLDPTGLVDDAPPLPAAGHRTTVRMVATAEGLAFRRAHDHDVVDIDTCLVAHPLLDDLIHTVSVPAGREVTLRVGARTGERLVLVDGDPHPAVAVPDDTRLVFGAELAAGTRAWFHEEVAGERFRISAESFFQARPDGADALVAEVRQAVGDAADGGTLVDLYAGVGLFAATVGDPDHVIAVESAPSSAADARHNLGPDGAGRRGAKVVRADVARFRRRHADAVVADPSRGGLGKQGVRTVRALGAPVVVLVSCDAGSLGRDARLLTDAGYRLTGCRLVEMFPQTPHVEVVSRFERLAGQRLGA